VLDLMSLEYAAQFLRVNGFSLRENPQSALEWCLAGARRGSVEAQCVASTILRYGFAGVHNEAEAIRWCNAAAASGNLDARCALAGHRISTKGDYRDVPLGIATLEDLISKGHLPAMVSMALLKLSGYVDLVAQNSQEGIDLLSVPAQAGNSYAQCLLGVELVGNANESTRRVGVRWLLKAAEGGNATAHELLSTYYREGDHGLPVDLERAEFHAKSVRR
jgi:TPR repeat protein